MRLKEMPFQGNRFGLLLKYFFPGSSFECFVGGRKERNIDHSVQFVFDVTGIKQLFKYGKIAFFQSR